MKLMVCVDEKFGMMFHHRRQSMDTKVREDMLAMVGEQKLFVSPYTARQFTEVEQEQLHISPNFLQEAGRNDYCFIEDTVLVSKKEENHFTLFLQEKGGSLYEIQEEEIILYYWNRRYPADIYFPLQPEQYQLVYWEVMEGKSHKEIWKEILTRNEVK